MRYLPNPVGPSCATPLPGRDTATDHGVAGLSVTSALAPLSRPRTQYSAMSDTSGHTAGATGGAGQVSKYLGEPRGCPGSTRPFRCCATAPNPHCHSGSSIVSQKSSMGLANHGPTDPQVHPDLANTEDPIAGVVVARWFQPPWYRRRAAQGRGSGRPRPASWVLNRVEDVGPPMPPGPM